MNAKTFTIQAIFFILMTCAGLVQSANPPRAVVMEKIVRDAKFVFIGRLVSAKKISEHEFAYGLVVKEQVAGKLNLKCMVSNVPYEIGVDYVFFPSALKRECVDGGGFFRRALAIKSFEGGEYVLFSDDRYIYPDFNNEVLTVQSVPNNSHTSIALWTGIKLNTFLSFIKDQKTP